MGGFDIPYRGTKGVGEYTDGLVGEVGADDGGMDGAGCDGSAGVVASEEG